MRPLLLASDLHYQYTAPVCRTDKDRWMEIQYQKTRALSSIAQQYDVEAILIAGDISDSPFSCSKMIIPLMRWWRELFNFCPVVIIPGQHDLPNHRLSEWKEGVMGSLATLDRVWVLIDPSIPFITESYCIYGFPWGVDIIPPEGSFRNNRRRVAMVHTLAYDGKKPYPGAPETGNVKQLSEKFAWADLVVSGDNHQTFTHQSPDHLWVNPGSFLRTSAKQIDHTPTVFLWEGHHKGITGIPLPANPSAVTREHIESERGDERIEAFVSSIQQDKNSQHLSFKDAVRARLEHPSVSNGVRTWAEKALNTQGDNNGR